MAVRVREIDLRIVNMWARIPFRFGITTMTAVPHLFLRALVEIDGRQQWGIAADHLPPKWFTKDAATSYRDDLAQMLKVIDTACDVARATPAAPSVFEFWYRVYQNMAAWGGGWNTPLLLTHFGTSLIERATIDAFCRAEGISFFQAAQRNWLGVQLHQMHPELADAQPRDLLPGQPRSWVFARHTVGLTDPLTDADIRPVDRVDDGFPQSLEGSIREYGLTHFKIKLWGDAARDLDRLCRVADVLERVVHGPFHITLDGNENFKDVEPFGALWNALAGEPTLATFLRSLIFVEQPIHRSVALSAETGRSLRAWADRPPIIIDESDAVISSSREALDAGYAGTSHKNCKGVFKGLANACLLEFRRRQTGNRSILSGEDLSNVGPVALLQDLAAMGTFGVTHVERNGQHYFRGLSMIPPQVQQQVLRAHPDLYRLHADTAAVRIDAGRMQIGSVMEAPFGMGFELDAAQFTPAGEWEFSSLGLT